MNSAARTGSTGFHVLPSILSDEPTIQPSATLNTSRQMGGVLGVAVLGGMAGSGIGGTHSALLIATVALAAVALLGAIGMAPRRPAEPAAQVA